jgi:SNF2 family DNA or RNA helicase
VKILDEAVWEAGVLTVDGRRGYRLTVGLDGGLDPYIGCPILLPSPSSDGRFRAYNMPPFVSRAMVEEFLLEKCPGATVIGDDVWRQIDQWDSLKVNAAPYHSPDVPVPLPERVRETDQTPDEYQLRGASFLLSFRRAVLADAVGVGKTRQVILAADQLPEGSRILVVCPKSLIYQWIAAIEAYSLYPDVSPVGPSGDLPDTRWLVTNYETVVRRCDEMVSAPIVAMVADEAVRLKNQRAKRTRAFFRCAQGKPYVWLVTAVPIRNRVYELWSLLHTLDPKRFSSWDAFRRCFLYLRGRSWGIEEGAIRPEMERHFHDLLIPYVLRRDKSILNLPPITEEEVLLPLEGKARAAYDQMEEEFVVELEGVEVVSAPNVLARLTRLRQIALDPGLLGIPGESPKTLWLLDWLEDYADEEKVLIFTPFAQYANRLYDLLAEYRPVLITGDKTAREREDAKNTFNRDPSCRALIGTTDAGGEGLNLQESARVVVLAGFPWTPDAIEQVIGRVYRRGQRYGVHVFSLVSPDTVEVDQLRVLQRKEELSRLALNLKTSVERLVAKEVAERVADRRRALGV